MSKKTHTEPWRKIAETWHKLGPGPRPSKGNIRTFEALLKKYTKGKKHPRVLVMGSTPEIRDMLAKHRNVQVTLVDVNIEMTLAMTELMKQSSDREVWTRASWLTAPLPPASFDVVFGDYIKGNLKFKDQFILYKNIASWLKPKGVFVERVFSYFPETSTVADVEPIIKKYSKIKPTWQKVTDLWMQIMFLTQPYSKHPATKTAFDILDKYQHVPHMKTYRKMIFSILPPGKVWDYNKKWKDDQKSITTSLKIIDELPDDTFNKTRTRIIVCKRK